MVKTGIIAAAALFAVSSASAYACEYMETADSDTAAVVAQTDQGDAVAPAVTTGDATVAMTPGSHRRRYAIGQGTAQRQLEH